MLVPGESRINDPVFQEFGTRVDELHGSNARGLVVDQEPLGGLRYWGGLADPMGLGSLGALCQADAIAWCKGIMLPRGEAWHWVKCGTVAGNLCHWLKFNAAGVEPAAAYRNILSGIRRVWAMGNISDEEAYYLWHDVAGFDLPMPGDDGPAVAGAGGAAFTGGGGGGGVAASGGGMSVSSLLPASVSSAFSSIPSAVWYGLGALALVVMVKGRR